MLQTTPTQPFAGFSGQFIDGIWKNGTVGKVLPVTNPYDGALLAEISLASKADLDLAFNAAARAQIAWAKMMPSERIDLFLRAVRILDDRKEEIIGWLIRESGSTRIKANIEWGSVRAGMIEVSTMPTAAHGAIIPIDRPGKEARVYRKPVGVVGVISPWNFPLHLSNRSVAPAIALGNAVVLKPSSDTPITGGLLLARIYEEAGLPPGVLNVVIGAGNAIGDAFCAHPTPRVLTFTGSTAVGRRVAQVAANSSRLKKSAWNWAAMHPWWCWTMQNLRPPFAQLWWAVLSTKAKSV